MRLGALLVGGGVAVFAALALLTCGGSEKPLNLNVHSEFFADRNLAVGGNDSMTFTITNKDTDIADLVLIPNDGKDNWLDHHGGS